MLRRALVPLLLASLALAACGSEDGAGGGDSRTIEMVAQDFAFQSTQIVVDPNEEITIELNNSDGTTHSFSIEEIDFEIEADGGDVAGASFTAPEEDATLVFFCKFHPDQMKGTVQVGAGGDQPSDTEDEGSETGEGVNENDTGIDY